MPFPSEERLKNLIEQYGNDTPVPSDPHIHQPGLFSGQIVDIPSRTDSGYYLKVAPYIISNVTQAGEPSFTYSPNYVKVFPQDVAPTDVKDVFGGGGSVQYWTMNGSGAYAAKVVGTYVTTQKFYLPICTGLYLTLQKVDETSGLVWTDERFT